MTSTFCWSCQISSSKYHHQNAKISAKYCWIMQVWPSEYRQNIIQISAIITWLITWISTIFYLDFLTVISRIITVTRYACRYLTVTLFISNNGRPWMCYWYAALRVHVCALVVSRIVLEQAARRAVLPTRTRIRHLPQPAFKTSNITHTKPEKSCSRTGQNGVRLRSALLRICHAQRLQTADSMHRYPRNTHSKQDSGQGTVQ